MHPLEVILQNIDDHEIDLSIEAALSQLTKPQLRQLLKNVRPGPGERIPSLDRDPFEKVVQFLLQRGPQKIRVVLSSIGLAQRIRSGDWASLRKILLPNLPTEAIPSPGDLTDLKRLREPRLNPAQVEAFRGDLQALTPSELSIEERRVVLIACWCFPEVANTIEGFLETLSGSGSSTEEDTSSAESPGELASASKEDAVDGEEDEPDDTRVRSDEFTPLDRLLIRAAVDSLGGIHGALDSSDVRTVIEELIHLNATRQQSYFHRGFFAVLSEEPQDSRSLEANVLRRTWEWAGRIAGHARRMDPEGILREFEEQPDLAAYVASGGSQGATLGAMEEVLKALLASARLQEASALLKPEMVGADPRKFIPHMMDKGRSLIRARKIEEAKLVVGKTRQLLQVPEILDKCPDDLAIECDRRWGQVLRGQGAFRDAKSVFDQLLECGANPSEALTEIALCAAKARWLEEIQLPEKGSEKGALIQRLAPSLEYATEAYAQDERSPGAAYLLGIEALLHRDGESRALNFLEEAYARALAREETYVGSLFFQHVCLSLSIAILLAMDDSQFEKAHELLTKALVDGRLTRLPLDFLRRAVEVVKLGGHPACLKILGILHDRCPEVLEEHLRNDEFLDASPGIQELLLSRSKDEARTPQTRWKDLEALLRAAIRTSNLQRADELIGEMEGLAFTYDRLTQAYLGVLENPELAGSCLEDAERFEAIRALHRVRGNRREEGAAALELARLALGKEDNDLAEAYLEIAQSLGFSKEELRLEFEWLRDLQRDRQLPEEMEVRSPASILFIGGNEIQAQYGDHIRSHFRRKDPELEVSFLHTGWSSNWNVDVDEVRRRLTDHDAVVLMRFTRTLFGRHVRRMAGEHRRPWIPCTGHGRDSMIRAIERAATVVRAKSTGS